MKDLKPKLIAEYISGSDFVKFYDNFSCHCFFENELEIVEQSQAFFDFVTSVIETYSYVVRNISYSYNVVDNWHELNECFESFESMSDTQKTLFDYVLCDYSYSYDLQTLTNYCLENACLFVGSASDYAYELIHDCYDVKSMGNLANYIDYEAFARDMLCNSEIVEISYNLYWTNPHNIY